MKKNLAKRIVLGLLTGAVLMSSSVAWAGGYLFEGSAQENSAKPEDSISIIGNVYGPGDGSGAVRSIAIGVNSDVGSNLTASTIASDAVAVGYNTKITDAYGVALGSEAKVTALGGVALGANTKVETTGSVALGIGSAVNSGDSPYVVSVGSGNAEHSGTYQYRKIVNVANGNIDSADSHEAVTGGQLYTTITDIKKKIGGDDFSNLAQGSNVNSLFTNDKIVNTATTLVGAISTLDNQVYLNRQNIGSVEDGFENTHYIQNKNLTDAAKALDDKVKENADAIANVYTRTEADNKFLTITDAANTYVTIQKDANDNNKTTTSIGDFVVKDTGSSSTVTINAGADQQVIFDEEGITVGKNSTRMDGKGFYVWADGQNNNTTSNHNPDKAIASINDKGEIKAANGAFKVDADGNVTGGKYNGVDIVELANNVASNDAVAGINQRLDKTNAKINKVGAGAAALAALHPLDYDPDDKLTFSAGMGNYAGENAAALGAFYRPNEKFMLSLGGTMGNGENMVNLGISIGLDKANGFAKMSKRELIQEVNAVKAENEAIKADNEAMKAEMAEMKAMLQELLAKK